jgi:hypothetical protein
MRPIHLAILLWCAVPGAAAAKAWQGIQPGQSTRADVVARFGEPSTQGRHGGRTVMVYKGDQAISGTRQAQFFPREDGVILEVLVFPAATLEREAVEGTYGKGAHKSFTDEFQPAWVYKALGVTVFFGKDGAVEAISFKPPEPAAPPPREAAPPAKAPARPAGG